MVANSLSIKRGTNQQRFMSTHYLRVPATYSSRTCGALVLFRVANLMHPTTRMLSCMEESPLEAAKATYGKRNAKLLLASIKP